MTNRSFDARADERREALGRAIRKYRGDRKQSELGALLGVPQTTISRWEVGLVDLGVEQVRGLERALDLPLGTLGRAAGYVDPCLTGDEDTWPGFRVSFVDDFELAKSLLEAAAALDIGVRIFNRWRELANGEKNLEWVIVLYEDAYEVDE
ncbi:MAG TPA: helix-turn-helix transcriptional regulator [Acidimicrobiales bacterium]|nr:helix-turn-helix transcriptional regulator [Acidimicrobiales bacterium]